MRIVAGEHRGRILKTPQGPDIRPTSDKVRQAVFNALQSRGAVVDAVALDAFCGTGALGLEALSQGAASCAFMDIAASSLQLARDNAALLKVTDRTTFYQRDATQPGKPEGGPVTLLLLDPPYHKNLVPQALNALRDWLAPECFVVVETEKTAGAGLLPGEIVFDRAYGDTRVVILRL